MTLRLVLVSLVAGLGIGVPGWPTLEGWVASSQKWVNTRLAEMDHRRSDEANYVVIHDLLKVEMDRARAAREASRHATRTAPAQAVGSAVLANARALKLEQTASPSRVVDAAVVAVRRVEAPRLTFDPIIVGDRLQTGAAYELNFRNEGLNLPSPPVMLPLSTPSVQPIDLAQLAASRYGASTLATLETMGRGMRDAAARELAARQEREAREANALAFESLGRSESLYFAEAPAPVVVEISPFEEMESTENLYFAEAAPAQVQAAPTSVVADALPDDPFAPVEMIAAVQPTNSSREEISERTTKASSVDRPEVNRAVRLTRDALFAWVNVLSGPALVTVAPSSSVAR